MNTPPDDNLTLELLRRQNALQADQLATLKGGGGGGTSDAMEGRVSKLEAFVEVSREDLREIRGDLKAIVGRLGSMPTKGDLNSWKWQWLLASVAIFAVLVGSILGGLAWLDPH